LFQEGQNRLAELISQQYTCEPVGSNFSSCHKVRNDLEVPTLVKERLTKPYHGRLQLQFGDKLKELASQAVEARDERKTIIETFRSWNQERVGLIARMENFAEQVVEAQRGFAQIKWLLDRASAVIWAIIGVVVAFAVLIFILIAVVLRLYLWVRNVIVPKDLR
jgi:hypothetical protein